jgi:hypothetical protein
MTIMTAFSGSHIPKHLSSASGRNGESMSQRFWAGRFADWGRPDIAAREQQMNLLMNRLAKSSVLDGDLDYHLIRASMVIIFLFFGYQKWFEYEAQVLIPYISNGPLIFWLYPIFGIRGASWFLGVSE